jgi:citrate lyase subunit beta/citryl-CoA lyase
MGQHLTTSVRSLLFAPGNRPELLKKFPRSDADAYVIDFEDGTPEPEKQSARNTLADVVPYLREQKLRGLIFVRTNSAASPHTKADLEAALQTDIDGLVIPKLGAVGDLHRFGQALAEVERQGTGRQLRLIGLIESVAGVMAAPQLATGDDHLCALAFGGEDFISDIGGRRTPEGLEVLYARSQVVLAARAAGLEAIDQVVVDIRDDDQFRRDAIAGRNLGYTGKMCLLPRQVTLANDVFSPTSEEVDRSRRLIEAYDAGIAAGRGVTEFEGLMVDPPLLKRARAIIEGASRTGRK